MTFSVHTGTTKQLYIVTNFSILLFTLIWVVLFVIQLFNYQIIELITIYLIIFSLPIFIIGSLCAFIGLNRNKTVEITELQVQQLILNINTEDFKKENFNNLKTDNNFIVYQNFSHCITSSEALELFKIAKKSEIEVKTKQSSLAILYQSPKEIFNNCMGILWGAS